MANNTSDLLRILETHSFTKPSNPDADWCVDCQNHNPCDARIMAEAWSAAQKAINTDRPPTVLVIDDPEHGVFVDSDDEVRFITMDLGGGFDVTRLTEDNRSTIEEYVEGWLAQADTLPATSKLTKIIEDTCDGVLREVGSSLDAFRAVATVDLS